MHHYAHCLVLPSSNFLHKQTKTLHIGLQDSRSQIVKSLAMMGNSESDCVNLHVWLNHMLANKMHLVDQQSDNWNSWIIAI
jgi:hypothetical protein